MQGLNGATFTHSIQYSYAPFGRYTVVEEYFFVFIAMSECELKHTVTLCFSASPNCYAASLGER